MSTTQETQSPAASAALLMNRREAVRRLGLIMGVAMIGSEAFLRGETVPKVTYQPFTEDDQKLLDAVGETIIPAGSPENIQKVAIGAFITKQVTDCYNDQQHATFAEGLVKLNAASTAKYGGPFLSLTQAQRTDLLNAIDAESKAKGPDGKPLNSGDHYIRMLKELTVIGYFSSQIGCTESVTYIEVPGAYHGDVPYKKGDPVWY